jgi:hypothetical protein
MVDCDCAGCTVYYLCYIFFWGYWVIDWPVQSSIYVPMSNPLRHAHWPCSLPMTPATFDFGNPLTDSDSHMLARDFFVFWPESFDSLFSIVFCAYFFLVFCGPGQLD